MKILLLAAFVFAADSEPLFHLEPAFETVSGAYWGSFQRDGKLRIGNTIWDTNTGAQVGVADELPGVEKALNGNLAVYYEQKTVGLKAVEALNDTTYIHEADAVSHVYLWDLEKGKKGRKLGKFRFHCTPTASGFQPINCPRVRYSFSPDGRRVVLNVPAGDWRKHRASMPRYFPLYGWKSYLTDAGGELKALPGYAFFLSDGRLASLIFREGSVEQVLDVESGNGISFPRNASPYPISLQFSADESVFALHYYFGHEDPTELIQVWRFDTGERLIDFQHRRGWAADPTLTLAADGSWAIIKHKGEGFGEVVLRGYDLRNGGAARPLPSLEAEYILDTSSDGKYLVADKKGGPAVVYRIIGGAPPRPAAAKIAAATNVDNPPAAKLAVDPNAYAVVIGVEKYRETGIPKVDYAARDAATVHRYLTESLGFDAANVVLLQDERATKTDLEKHLGAWLKNRVNEKSRVFVYYAGHGAPNPATGQGFLIPYEGDPNYTDETAYPIQSLYDTLAKLPAKEVTVVLDACFSGSGGRSLLAKGARPLVTQAKAKAGGNTSVISAASGAQISASHPQARHGLLTYFLLEGLHGAADADKDGAITTAELFGYARPSVEREARKQNLEQTPTLAGPGSTVWLKKP